MAIMVRVIHGTVGAERMISGDCMISGKRRVDTDETGSAPSEPATYRR
jgi:hypothetical protein